MMMFGTVFTLYRFSDGRMAFKMRDMLIGHEHVFTQSVNTSNRPLIVIVSSMFMSHQMHG